MRVRADHPEYDITDWPLTNSIGQTIRVFDMAIRSFSVKISSGVTEEYFVLHCNDHNGNQMYYRLPGDETLISQLFDGARNDAILDIRRSNNKLSFCPRMHSITRTKYGYQFD